MKRIAFIILCLFAIVGCSTTKKAIKSSESAQLSTESQESSFASSEKFIDTTKTENGKITITEIEFYPPTVSDEPKNNTKPPNNVSGLSLSNVGNIDNAAIKSIKQTTIESESEKKGESKESSSNESAKSEALVASGNKEIQSMEAPAPDPYRWRYIFYILALISIVLLYLKRVPVLNWIKTILSSIRKIF